jgi:hypothetical protein
MSLTRKQWLEIFTAAKNIDKQTDGLITQTKKLAILRETTVIKKLVQEVVGRLE